MRARSLSSTTLVAVIVLAGTVLINGFVILLRSNWNTWNQFCLGILGNVLAALIVLPGFWLLNFLEIRSNKIRKFFGIRPNTTFFIFVGHLVHENTSLGLAGVEELNEANELRSNLQSSVPGLGDVYLLRRLKLMDVEVKIIVADVSHDYAQYINASFITIASGGSNGVSKLIESQLGARVDFASQEIKIENMEDEKSLGRGLIVCKRSRENVAWFYAAGQTEPDTAASARFLKENWSLMFQKYPNSDFYYLLNTQRNRPNLPPVLPSVIRDSELHSKS